MIRLHTIGDSHADGGTWGGVDILGLEIITHSLSPMTCASFGTSNIDISKFGVREDDWVCFCFGEIDCRDNIGKYESWWEVINLIADNYFKAISKYNLGRVFVFSVPPAVIQKTASGNPWPCTGTDEERRQYVWYMNRAFKERCKQYGYEFFDVHDKYADENGFFNLKYRDNCVHIADPVFLKEYLNDKVQKG